MKRSIIVFYCLIMIFTTFGQVRLDVAGDAKIQGKIALINAPGDSSIFIGFNTGKNDDGENDNLFLGNKAGEANITGGANIFIGSYAGNKLNAGFKNVLIGQNSGKELFGAGNTFIGQNSGPMQTAGVGNTLIGMDVAKTSTFGIGNTFVGSSAGIDNISGEESTYLGSFAGRNDKKGTRNTLIGNNTGVKPGADSLDRAIAIGYAATVACSNCAVIGGTGIDSVKVGIGTENPLRDFHIKQTGNDKVGGIMLERRIIYYPMLLNLLQKKGRLRCSFIPKTIRHLSK